MYKDPDALLRIFKPDTVQNANVIDVASSSFMRMCTYEIIVFTTGALSSHISAQFVVEERQSMDDRVEDVRKLRTEL